MISLTIEGKHVHGQMCVHGGVVHGIVPLAYKSSCESVSKKKVEPILNDIFQHLSSFSNFWAHNICNLNYWIHNFRIMTYWNLSFWNLNYLKLNDGSSWHLRLLSYYGYWFGRKPNKPNVLWILHTHVFLETQWL